MMKSKNQLKHLLSSYKINFFGEVSSNKKLQSLNPFFDNENILHVGGRLGNVTDLTFDHRYPIMIPCAYNFEAVKNILIVLLQIRG